MTSRLHTIEVGPGHWNGQSLTMPAEPEPRGLPRAKYREPSFLYLFRPILPALKRYWWLDVPLAGTGAVQDPAFHAVWDALDFTQLVPPNTLLPRFAKYITGERCSFCGFLANPGSVAEVEARMRRRGRITPWYEQTVDIEIVNVDDDAFWILRTSDVELVELVQRHAQRLEGVFARSPRR